MAPIARAQLQQPPVAPLLRRLLRDTAVAVEAAEATLWVRSPDDAQLDAAINHGSTFAGFERLSQAVEGSVIGMVLATNLGSCIGPGDHHDPTIDRLVGTTTETMVAVPVPIGQSTIGVLSAINRRGGLTFDHLALAEMEWRAYLAGLIVRDHLSGAASDTGGASNTAT